MSKKRVLGMLRIITRGIFLPTIGRVVPKITLFTNWGIADSSVLSIYRRVTRISKGVLVDS